MSVTEQLKYTKGPWQQNGSHFYGPDPERLLLGQLSYIGRGYQGESESNGRLILAAPDLLEALIQLLPEGWGDGDVMDHIPGVRAARLAIAKATGDQ